ncbi:MAG: monovalent cation/H+ antiporter subunit D family protein [Thermodesulfobacteriota bacterium]
MTLTENLPVLVIIVPLISAIVTPLVSMKCRDAAWYIAAVGTLGTFIIAISLLSSVMDGGPISYHMGGWEPPWGIEYVVDYMNGLVISVVSFIAIAVAFYSKSSVAKEIPGERIPLFYAVYMLFITGLMGVSITGDIFNLYVFLEITSLSIYTLIAMGRKRDALIASFNYLILGTIAGTFILIGVGYLYMMTGTLNMADLRGLLPGMYNTTAVRTAFAFFTVGLSLKIALFPLHIWLPNAYTHAPSTVSAVVAATATKVGAYVLLRIMFTVFTPEFNISVVPVTYILIFFSCLAIVAGSVLAIAQKNLKRMLAYSSIGQIGYIVLGAALVNKLALTGSLIHILNHAVMKGTLFMVAGAVVYTTGAVEIQDLKGLARKMPWSMAAFTVGGLSMIGVPLTVGFVSKWYLALGAIDAGMWFIVPIILISSLLTAVYFWRIIEGIYFHEGGGGTHAQGVYEAPFGMVFPTLVMALLCLVFGVFAYIPVNVAAEAAAMLLGGK